MFFSLISFSHFLNSAILFPFRIKYLCTGHHAHILIDQTWPLPFQKHRHTVSAVSKVAVYPWLRPHGDWSDVSRARSISGTCYSQLFTRRVSMHGRCHDFPCLARMSSAVLCGVVPHFPTRSVERNSVEQEDSLSALLQAVVYPRLWVRNSVSSTRNS